MKPFDEFWEEMLNELAIPQDVRNWTAEQNYSIGGQFIAVAFRALEPVAQRIFRHVVYSNTPTISSCAHVRSLTTARLCRRRNSAIRALLILG